MKPKFLFLVSLFAMFLLIGVTAQGAEGEAASHAELIKESLAALKENTVALKSLTEALKIGRASCRERV